MGFFCFCFFFIELSETGEIGDVIRRLEIRINGYMDILHREAEGKGFDDSRVFQLRMVKLGLEHRFEGLEGRKRIESYKPLFMKLNNFIV